jgi:protein-disulfide isomerase
MSRKRPKIKTGEPEEKGHEEKEQEEEEYDAFGFIKKKKQTAAVAGVFFLFGVFLMWLINPPLTAQVISGGLVMSSDQVGQETIDYINGNILREGFTASLAGTSENNGMYEVSVDIKEDGSNTSQNVIFYVSGTGELLFFNEPIDMTEPLPKPEEPEQPQPEPDAGVPKSDRPVANVFIMSYCPYGLQMEKAMIPVMELLGDKADINIDYVHYIMHGMKEVVQNNYQHCIEKDQPEVFVDYLKCFVQSDDHEKCMTEAGVDQAKLDTCLADLEEEFKVTEVFESSTERFPPYPVDAVLAQQYGVRGSPTFVINGVTMSVNRSPEAVKQAICDAFTTPPEECSQTLSTASEGPGIGALGSGSGSGSQGTC